MFRKISSPLGLATLVVMSFVAAGPTAAASGESALASSSQGSQTRCRYEATQVGSFGWTEAKLRRIVVTPPQIYGLSRGQTVGWRFVVRRSIDYGPWKVTYQSPVQKATAGPNRAASFSKQGVAVALPSIPSGSDWDHWDVHYRVVLKMFWYRSDGSLQQTASHVFSRYNTYVDGVLENTWAESCQAEIRQFFDGP
jgi:hypothetical protein